MRRADDDLHLMIPEKELTRSRVLDKNYNIYGLPVSNKRTSAMSNIFEEWISFVKLRPLGVGKVLNGG